jgi:hypothetical protein
MNQKRIWECLAECQRLGFEIRKLEQNWEGASEDKATLRARLGYRFNDIHIELLEGHEEGPNDESQGAVLLGALLVECFKNFPEAMLGLFPTFAAMRGDIDGPYKLADVEWSLMYTRPVTPFQHREGFEMPESLES